MLIKAYIGPLKQVMRARSSARLERPAHNRVGDRVVVGSNPTGPIVGALGLYG